MALDVRGVCSLLQVYDMPTSVRFYRDILGFEVVATSPNLGGEGRFHWCLLRLCGSEVRRFNIFCVNCFLVVWLKVSSFSFSGMT